MDAVDEYIPTPERDDAKPFLMPVEDVFTITGRGTVATGRVERGMVKVGEEVEIVGLQDEKKKTTVTGLEMFRKVLDFAEAGDNIGALLRGVNRDEIERGQVLSKPGSIHPHTKFQGQVYVLKKDEGGRHTPFFNNYRPQFYFRTTDVTGVITLPEGVEMCMPGDNVTMDVELITPIAIEEGLRFAIREGAARLAPALSARSTPEFYHIQNAEKGACFVQAPFLRPFLTGKSLDKVEQLGIIKSRDTHHPPGGVPEEGNNGQDKI